MGDQNEGLKVSNIVIGVLIFLVVVSAVVAFVMWGANKFNQSTADLEDTVTGVEIARFNQYDENDVSGSDVLAAAKTYRTSEMAIFVSTKKLNSGSVYDLSDAVDELGDYEAFGYNGNGADDLEFNDETGHFEASILVAEPENNTNYTHLSTKGQDAYINSNGRYWATLVYDADVQEVAGILFRQIK